MENTNTFYDETLSIIAKRKSELADKWEKECIRLLKSGAIDRQDHNRAILFGVAFENMADNYLRGERKTKDYKNLQHF